MQLGQRVYAIGSAQLMELFKLKGSGLASAKIFLSIQQNCGSGS